ncbi:TetR/AcrR family transcriptional regulator [Sphaerisporangium fuscum]|uniref:TetR/AcrR family transcriptional regulator n=1 Tax=Sphaerisporangium fuscum TaxID=2835868 RepID=UPI001BDD904B|nr:TetR/AcrR family transcriptional regulator [Sphaerisporangium fuscum]
MTDAAAVKREQIAAAALGVFGRYGYRRASMELIAQAARVSRPAIYQYFTGKEDVFRAVGHQLVHGAIVAAEAARHSGRPIADRIYEVLAIKIDLFAGTVEARFRAEMLAEAEVIAQDIMAAFESGYLTVIEATLNDAREELDLLDVALSSRDAAAILVDALTGIAGAKAEPAALRARLRQLAELTVRGLTSKPLQAL